MRNPPLTHSVGFEPPPNACTAAADLISQLEAYLERRPSLEYRESLRFPGSGPGFGFQLDVQDFPVAASNNFHHGDSTATAPPYGAVVGCTSYIPGGTVPECEAERRFEQALYAMKNDVAGGRFGYPKYRQTLTGRNQNHGHQENP